MFPEWVEKYRAAGTTIKKIGKITPDGVINERVSINPQKTEACLLGTLVEGLDEPLRDLVVLKIKGAWYYTKMDRNNVPKLKEMKLYDNGKVVLSDI